MTFGRFRALQSITFASLFLLFAHSGRAADSTAPSISGHASTGPGGWDLTILAPTPDAPLGSVRLLGGVTGPVIEIVPPGEGRDCWCLNVKRTDTAPVDGDQRANVYIRDIGDGLTSFDQFSLISSIGGNCDRFATPGLYPFTQGDFKVTATPDADADGVPDDRDACPDTPSGSVVNASGCSVDQIAPCSGPSGGGTWRSHGHYVAALTKTAQTFYVARLITLRQRNEIIRAAAGSDCGRNSRERWLSRKRLQFQPHRGLFGR